MTLVCLRFKVKYQKLFHIIFHIIACHIGRMLYFLILNLRTCIIVIHTILQKIAFPCLTRYVDYIRFCRIQHLKIILQLFCFSVLHPKMFTKKYPSKITEGIPVHNFKVIFCPEQPEIIFFFFGKAGIFFTQEGANEVTENKDFF